MCRSSPLTCPSVDLKPPAAFCTENRVRQAVLFCGAIPEEVDSGEIVCAIFIFGLRASLYPVESPLCSSLVSKNGIWGRFDKKVERVFGVAVNNI